MNTDLVVSLDYKKPKLITRILIVMLLAFLFILVAAFTFLTVKSKQFVKEFAQAANITQEETLQTASSLLSQLQTDSQNVANLAKKYNFLILGTDKLSGRNNDPELTDTILLLQTDWATGKIKVLTFPRDLYLENYQTKINALYFYGKNKYPNNPSQFPQEVIEDLAGLKIDHVIVLGIEDVEKLIDIVGKIEIDVPKGFTDTHFPVPGVDVSKVTDPKVLYEEVSFTQGLQKMDGATALKYMRSRYSEGDEGTDEARAYRQQLVLQALFAQILQIRRAYQLGLLYRFYLDYFATALPLEKIAQMGAAIIDYLSQAQTAMSFEKHQLSIYPEDENGVIYNPPLWQSKQQWVYKIKDQSKFTESIHAIFD